MRKIKKLLIALGIGCLSLASCTFGSAEYDKIPDPGGDFAYDNVMVFFTEEASLLDKTWGPSDFPGFAFSEIRDNGLVGTRRFLIFFLAEQSRDNVLRAIYYLQKRVEVHSVFPNGISTGGV
ncbi:MAG: hypothetical protein FWC97_03050 [Treponema sp.]|nr:hypothetical protein [Treponema sp.]